MAQIAVPLAVAGTLLSTAGMIQQGQAAAAAGKAQEQALKSQAKQQEQAAGQARAASQFEAADIRRQGDLIQSRARAVAAASGAGATDPSVLAQMGGVEREIAIRTQLALSGGEERARGLEFGAEVSRGEGTTAQRMAQLRRNAAFTGAAATAATGGATLFERYG